MSWVSHNNVGILYRVHHMRHGNLTLLLAYLTLNLRPTFGIFILVFYVLNRHFQFVTKGDHLIRHVDCGDNQKRQRYSKNSGGKNTQSFRGRRRRRQNTQCEYRIEIIGDNHKNDAADKAELEQTLSELYKAFDAKHASEPLDRIKL